MPGPARRREKEVMLKGNRTEPNRTEAASRTLLMWRVTWMTVHKGVRFGNLNRIKQALARTHAQTDRQTHTHTLSLS